MRGHQFLPMLTEYHERRTHDYDEHNRQSSTARSIDQTVQGMQKALRPLAEPDATADAHADLEVRDHLDRLRASHFPGI